MTGITTKRIAHENIIAPFKPLPWQIPAWRDKSFVMLLTGSAGGGKSRLAAEKIHGYCLKYPGATWLMLRKAREWAGRSTVPFYAQTVVGNDPQVRFSKSDGAFYYSNGSVVYSGGMMDDKQRESVRSIGGAGGLDGAWLEEANAFTRLDFEEIIGRTRHTAADWQQIILTTNPDSPLHWIYSDLIQGGGAKVYYSGALDNPNNSSNYITHLQKLSGVMRDRLVLGNWVQAACTVYGDVWDENNGSVTEAADYEPGAGPIVWACDDGYSAGSAPNTRGIDPVTGFYVGDAHPRVILFCQLKPNGHIDVFDESYACLKLSNEHISEALQRGYPEPDFATHGPGAAEIRGRFYEAGISPKQCTAKVDESIKELRGALAADVNGWRRVRVHPRVRNLRAEMAAYVYEPGGEVPVKQFDHGPDAIRALVWLQRWEK